MDFALWFELCVFVLLMIFSGVFSSSETALFSLKNVDLEQMRQRRNPRVSLIEQMLSQPRRLIITILIGNELVNVAASVLSASVIIRFLGDENKWINLFVMVPLLLLFGEITPKTLAIKNNIRFAGFESRFIELFARLIMPLRWLVRHVADTVLTLILGKERSKGNIITDDMVRTLARDVVDHSATCGEAMDIAVEKSHSRLLVSHERVDRAIGMLNSLELLGVDRDESIQPFIRPVSYIPGSKSIQDLLYELRQDGDSMAVVVDEFGGAEGLITIEDIVEEVVEEIGDEYDKNDEE